MANPNLKSRARRNPWWGAFTESTRWDFLPIQVHYRSTERVAAKGCAALCLPHWELPTVAPQPQSLLCGLQIWLIGSLHSTSVASKGHAGSLAFIPRGRKEQGSGILTSLQSWGTQRADLWFGRPCRVKSQPSFSLHVPWACQKPLHFLPLKKRSAVLESSPEHHRAGKIPQPSLTVGKKRCWTISGTIETGFYFC